MYKEDQREIITYKDVASNLKKKLSGINVRTVIVIATCIIIPLCLPLPLTIAGGVIEYVILSFCIITLTIGITVYLLISSCRISRKIDGGSFKVQEDVLVSVYTQTRIKYSHRRHIEIHEYVFNFESGKQFIVKTTERDGTRLEFSGNHSNKGDTFYIVTFDENPDDVVLVYSGVIFKYEDR